MNKEEERIVQFSLEGKCISCGEKLPEHKGFCDVMQSESQLELDFNAEDIVFNMSYQLAEKRKP